MDKNIEELVISAFILKRRRERARIELFNEKKREHFLWYMHDEAAFESNYMQKIEEPVSSTRIVYDILKKCGAPDSCYVMSLFSSCDGQIVTLEQGLSEVVFNGHGLISCIHGKLAYFEGEAPCGPGPPSRFLLMKK